MNLTVGIAAAIIGLLFVVLSFANVVPELRQSGVALIVVGGLVIGLSFVRKPATDETARKSTAETLLGIFYAPGEIFRNLRRHPRWLAAVIVMTVLSTVYANLFLYRLTPEKVTNFTIDKTLEMSFLNDQAKQQIEAGRPKAIADQKNPIIRAGQIINTFVGQTFLYAFLGAVFLLAVLAAGGKINYWQAFAAAVYANFPVVVIKFALNVILLFLKDPTDIHPVLGQSSLIQDSLNFLVLPSEHPILFTLLGAFSLFSFYWIWMTAIGLKDTGEKVSPTAAWSATLIVWVIGLLFGVGMAAAFPSFIS